MIQKKNKSIKIKYYDYNNSKIKLLYLQENKCVIKYLFEDINQDITKSSLNENYTDKLKQIFIEPKDDNNINDLLLETDNKLLNFLDEEFVQNYNELKNKIEKEEQKDIIINSNYILSKIKRELNNKNNIFLNQDNKKLQELLDLNKLCCNIRKKYSHYLICLNPIINIYNCNNNYLIFLGKNFCIFSYDIKNNKFVSSITNNFIPNFKKDINSYEIKYIFSGIIILNNKCNIFLIDIQYFEIKKIYNYYSQIIGNGKYLLFDNLVNENIQYSVIDLSSNLNIENHEFTEIFKFKLNNNNPDFILSNNKFTFISIYENNQLSINNYKLNELEDNHNFQNIRKATIISKIEKEIIPKNELIKHSGIYDESYHPKNLFIEKSYYCSKKGKEHFIEFEFVNEYYFLKFEIIFHEKYKECIPKKYSIDIYDCKKRQINSLFYETKENTLNYNENINEKL